MAELQVPIQTSPAYSLYKKKKKPPKCSRDFGDAPPGTQEQPGPPAPAEASFASADFGQYLSDVVRDADRHLQAVPQDSLQVFCTEGDSLVASSLSTLSSAGPDEGVVYDDIKAWGPKFEKLSELYSCVGAEGL